MKGQLLIDLKDISDSNRKAQNFALQNQQQMSSWKANMAAVPNVFISVGKYWFSNMKTFFGRSHIDLSNLLKDKQF